MSALIMAKVAESQFQLRRTVIANKSPFSAKVFRSGFPDEQWVFSFVYPWMSRAEALPLVAAVAEQEGGLGQLAVYDPDFCLPSPGTRALTETFDVSGAGQTGRVLNIGNGGAVGTLIARAGDRLWLTYPDGVYRAFTLVADAVTTLGGGGAALALDRPMRIAPASGAAVGFDWVSSFRGIPARLTESSQQTDRAGNIKITISGEELV